MIFMGDMIRDANSLQWDESRSCSGWEVLGLQFLKRCQSKWEQLPFFWFNYVECQAC
jgi:hypothetical protein